MSQEAPAETAPYDFGQYQLIEKIAQGGMAEIFKGKALDAHGIERPVVIKRILPHIAASPEFVDMLIDEAKIAVQLSHGNIAQIYDLGKVADDYFIVMEYVEGKTLSQIMKRLRTEGRFMPIPLAAAMCAEIASGLDYMHRKSDEHGHPLHIVHRDISPQNVILSTGGTVKIIDFGIARAKTRVSTTDSGILKGKFAYMSPEHAEGERLDWRSDIFSLGVILYELLTGQRLFKGKNNAETLRKVKRAKVPLPSGVRPEITRSLDAVVLKSLRKDREERYHSADELHRDLMRFLVTEHPQFSARDMTKFLHEIFPELAPPNPAAEEETHSRHPRIPSDRPAHDEHEHTVAADSEIIRQKLRETEVFDVPPKASAPDTSAPSSVVQFEERTARIRLTKVWPALAVLAGLMVLAGGFWLKSRPHASKPSIPEQAPILPATVLSTKKLEDLVQKNIPESLPAIRTEPQPEPAPAVTEGALAIQSTPPGALIFIDDVDTSQRTPSTLTGLAAGKDLQVGLHLENYKYWEGRAQVPKGGTSRISASLEVNLGDIEINSLPEGAEVLLNGSPAGRTPYKIIGLLPDSIYKVELRLAGFEVWAGDLKVFGGRREVLNVSLKKLQEP